MNYTCIDMSIFAVLQIGIITKKNAIPNVSLFRIIKLTEGNHVDVEEKAEIITKVS